MMKNLRYFVLMISFFLVSGLAAQEGQLQNEADCTYLEEQGIDQFAAEQLVNARGESIMDFIPVTGLLLMPESGNEKVIAFDPADGSLIDEFFFPGDEVNLTTPIQVIWNFFGTSFLISDQLKRLVQQYSIDGDFEQTFAPIGGEDQDILSNIRGIYMKPDGTLLVTVAGGANTNSIASFDVDGEYLGNFVDNNAGGLNGPWSIVYRADMNDYLITASGSNGIHRYDADGDFIEMFATGLNFPQQLQQIDNGNILVATFSAPSGVYEFDSEGNQIGYYSVMTGLRGVRELSDGNIMVTNSSGAHIINRNNQLLETVVSGQARHISHIMPMDMDFYALTLEMDPEDAGTVHGGGSYPEDFTATITATPNLYHEFVNWTDEDDNVVSTTPVFQFTMPAEDVTLTANFVALDVYDVTFMVMEDSADEDPIEEAVISIEGFDNIETDANGAATIALPAGSHIAHISKTGYVAEEVAFDVTDSDITIEVFMTDVIMPPANVEVHTDEMAAGEALLTWSDPADVTEFRYDDGVVDGQLGFQGTWNSVMGAVHHHNAILNEMTWHITSEGGPHNTVKVWVLGLDANGLPDRNNIVYTAEDVPNVDDQWNTYEFANPIEMPEGFFIGLSYNGFLGLATDDGVGEPWDFVPGTQFGVFNITDPTSDFTDISVWGFQVNYLLRAFGLDLGEVRYDFNAVAEAKGPAPVFIPVDEPYDAGSPAGSFDTRAFLGFNVYLNDNLVAEEIAETEYLFTNLPGGEHTAGVQTAYTTGNSEIVSIDFEVEGDPDVFEVIFHVDITDAVMNGQLYGFDPDEHHILITGDMVGWAEPGTDPEQIMEPHADDPMIYVATFYLEAGTYEYKYFSDLIGAGWDGGEWAGDPNRAVEVTDDMVVEDVFEVGDMPTFTVTFDVMDNWDDPIDIAVVTFNGMTNEPGDYVFTGITPGTYVYLVTADGYEPVDGEAEVTGDKVIEVMLDITPNVPETEDISLNIYPNPVRGNLHIKADIEIQSVQLVDLLGQVVYSSMVNDMMHEVNVSGLNNGIYIVQILTNEGIITHRVNVSR